MASSSAISGTSRSQSLSSLSSGRHPLHAPPPFSSVQGDDSLGPRSACTPNLKRIGSLALDHRHLDLRRHLAIETKRQPGWHDRPAIVRGIGGEQVLFFVENGDVEIFDARAGDGENLIA